MFNLFGGMDPQTRAALMDIAATHVAILGLLGEKGIITIEEYDAAKIKAISIVNQEMVAMREKWRADNPEQAKVADFLRSITKGGPGHE